jgi:hypothetical protein
MADKESDNLPVFKEENNRLTKLYNFSTEELLTETIDGVKYSYKPSDVCKICSSPESFRSLIDTLILTPKTYVEIQKNVRLLEIDLGRTEEQFITVDDIRNHARHHLPQNKNRVREIIEQKAIKKGKSLLKGDDLMTAEAFFQVIRDKGFEGIVEGDIVPNMAQIIYAQEMITKLEELEKKDVSQESVFHELNLIIQAIREVIPQELQRKLYDKIAEYQLDNENVIELSDGSEYDEDEEKWSS